jgi:transposase InsO family protein
MNKVRHQEDGTLSRNNLRYMLFLISEYELIKEKKHSKYKFVSEFYKNHGLTRQNFIKYYNRYKIIHDPKALLPQKRGPRYKTRRIPGFIEQKVIKLRSYGLSKTDIFMILQEKLKQFTPSKSTIYNIAKRNNLNRLKPKQKRIKRLIIKEKAGELAHMDCHYLPKGIIENDNKQYYLVAAIDDATRIVWASMTTNLKSITVMFASLKILNMINSRYNITFKELMTDNGAEFGSGIAAKNKDDHPFELMLRELGIKHIYTKPYRPQTNGKIERFWKTLNDDLIEETTFDSIEHFQDELQQYLLYYNEIRTHSALDDKTPLFFSQSCHQIT